MLYMNYLLLHNKFLQNLLAQSNKYLLFHKSSECTESWLVLSWGCSQVVSQDSSLWRPGLECCFQAHSCGSWQKVLIPSTWASPRGCLLCGLPLCKWSNLKSKGALKTKATVFYNLILKVTFHNCCHVLLVTQTNPKSLWEGTMQGYECQQVVRSLWSPRRRLPESAVKIPFSVATPSSPLSIVSTFFSHFLFTTHIPLSFSPKLDCSALKAAVSLPIIAVYVSFDLWQCPQHISFQYFEYHFWLLNSWGYISF